MKKNNFQWRYVWAGFLITLQLLIPYAIIALCIILSAIFASQY